MTPYLSSGLFSPVPDLDGKHEGAFGLRTTASIAYSIDPMTPPEPGFGGSQLHDL